MNTLSTGKDSISLYMQIKHMLTEKIGNGDWSPGALIPSEIQLAQDLGVSQGTVRKAITELVEKNILTRKQGRGTFVSMHDDDRALFHFFHIADDHGEKILPESRVLQCRSKTASRNVADKLRLDAGSKVISIDRIRQFNGKPIIAETISLPADRFEGLQTIAASELPNTLYALYESRYGIAIHSANERLKAAVATTREAALLNIEPGSPLLEIERIALTLDNTPVELRVSKCNSAQHHYQNTIY